MARVRGAGLEELLAHSDWLGRLAHRLAGAADAEDALQDTWLAAQRSPPDPERPPRPWLAGVLRNFLRARWQTDRRRRRREQAQVDLSPEGEAAVDAVYERVEMQRLVAELVMSLDEPIRTVLLLRYFEGHDSTRIGEILGLPPGTVRWRLKQALDHLRAEMDGRFGGDRRAWVLVLAPGALAGLPDPATALASTATAAAAPIAAPLKGALLAAGLALVAGAGIGLGVGSWSGTGAAPPPSSEVAAGFPAAWIRPAARPWTAHAGGAAVLTGTVHLRGRPEDGVVVVANPLTPARPGTTQPPLARTTTDDDGGFAFPSLPPGSYALTATGHYEGTARTGALQLTAARPVHGLVLDLQPADAGLRGQVLDSGGGDIPRARIRARLSEGQHLAPLVFETESGCLGRYRIQLRPGLYGIEVEADGYAPTRFSLSVQFPRAHHVRLHPGARLSGRVLVGPGRDAVVGAEVVARRRGDDAAASSLARTDEQGRFVFSYLDPGRYRLEARRDVLVGRSEQVVAVGAADRIEGIDLSVAGGHTVSGLIRSPAGAPIAGATVRASRDGVGPQHAPVATTAADPAGAFTLTGLAPGPHRLTATAPGYLAGRLAFAVDRSDRAAPTLVLVEEAVVEGQVVNRAGRAVAGARVDVARHGRLDPETLGFSHTDADGRFRIDGLPSGAIGLFVTDSTGVARAALDRLTVGETRRSTITLGPGATITGQVRREDGRPATGAYVQAIFGSSHLPPLPAATVAADGRYHLGPLLPGEIQIRAVFSGDDPFVPLPGPRPNQAQLLLGEGEERGGVDLLVWSSDLTISGRVVGPDGHPLPFAVVSAAPESAPDQSPPVALAPAAQALSGSDGTFAIEGLTRARHLLHASHPGHTPLQRAGVPGGTSGLQLRLSAVASTEDPP